MPSPTISLNIDGHSISKKITTPYFDVVENVMNLIDKGLNLTDKGLLVGRKISNYTSPCFSISDVKSIPDHSNDLNPRYMVAMNNCSNNRENVNLTAYDLPKGVKFHFVPDYI